MDRDGARHAGTAEDLREVVQHDGAADVEIEDASAISRLRRPKQRACERHRRRAVAGLDGEAAAITASSGAGEIDHRAGRDVYRSMVGCQHDHAAAGKFRGVDELLGDAMGDQRARAGHGDVAGARLQADIAGLGLDGDGYGHRRAQQRNRTAHRRRAQRRSAVDRHDRQGTSGDERLAGSAVGDHGRRLQCHRQRAEIHAAAALSDHRLARHEAGVAEAVERLDPIREDELADVDG